MSIIKEINELHLPLKTFVFAIALIMPFWYLDIYLFQPLFFLNSPIQMPIVATFCLSVVWYAGNILSNFFFEDLPNKVHIKPTPNSHTSLYVMGAINAVMYISIITFWGYVENWTFMQLIKTSFLILVIRNVIWMVRSMYKATKKQEA